MLDMLIKNALGNIDMDGIARQAQDIIRYIVSTINEMNERQKRIESHLERIANGPRNE